MLERIFRKILIKTHLFLACTYVNFVFFSIHGLVDTHFLECTFCRERLKVHDDICFLSGTMIEKNV